VPTLFDPTTRASTPLSKSLGAGHYLSIAFAPDGRRVAVSRVGEGLLEVDVLTGAVTRTFRLERPARRVRYVGDEIVIVWVIWAGGLWVAEDAF
jgi:hypothetical protein